MPNSTYGNDDNALVADGDLELALGGKIKITRLQDDDVFARLHLGVRDVAVVGRVR